MKFDLFGPFQGIGSALEELLLSLRSSAAPGEESGPLGLSLSPARSGLGWGPVACPCRSPNLVAAGICGVAGCEAVLEHVGADMGFGFGVGGGVGVETHGFGGPAVGHGSREDQVGKGHFLIGDGVGDLILRHKMAPLPSGEA
jgi:hypothetical protein